ncbi:MAG: hypothetical protein EAY70_01665 [Sphingomonadales bacterium]|nr:MAG: hypothetical protein EAY70_01665 [Sphingomonadales bacterium]
MAKTRDDSFMLILLNDVGAAISRRKMDDNQATRRDMIRTACAAIEGMVWIFREHVIDTADSTYGLEGDEKLILQERQLSVSEQGKITEQPRYLPLTTTIRFIARIANRLNDIDHFDFGASEWEGFRKAIEIRNRITHPKSADDLHVSKTDVEQVMNALSWFLEKLTEILAQSLVTQKRYLGQFKDFFEELKAGDPEITALYNAVRDNEA